MYTKGAKNFNEEVKKLDSIELNTKPLVRLISTNQEEEEKEEVSSSDESDILKNVSTPKLEKLNSKMNIYNLCLNKFQNIDAE